MSMKWLLEHGLVEDKDTQYTLKLIEMRSKANEKDKNTPKKRQRKKKILVKNL